ncbi:RnfH family protein [Halomonas halocynthiae]|uniref:RnfH family protein n=1 Tax=Halomonas halocynthiae TaxID=176290 RepID=UPI0004210ABD|nr:RnfH family protein [Halomonas halocynthiae]
MADNDSKLAVEVAFALPERQCIVELQVVEGTTAREAVAMARLENYFPQLSSSSFTQASLGIFGKQLKQPEVHVVREGDRVEVYRPLNIDPKAARLARAKRHGHG